MSHEHRDFRCPDCGQIVTCLSCLEIHAASLPRGPAFIDSYRKPLSPPAPQFETIGVNTDCDVIEPANHASPLPPALPPTSQQSLFASTHPDDHSHD